MAEFKKQYKLVMHESLVKLEALVYFEINHERWIPLGGAFFVEAPGWDARWYQTLWLPEPYWKDEPEVLTEDSESAIKDLSIRGIDAR